MNLSTLAARLRRPQPIDLVEVTFTGAPRAVTAVARAVAAVIEVHQMRHHVDGDQVIRIEATCHPRTETTR